MGSEKRRHDRYYVKMPVELVVGKASAPGETVDVSFGGLFLRTPHPPPARQLVKVALKLPPKDRPITLMAMAVFVEPPKSEPEHIPGVGLKLFGMDPSLQERWESFVKYVRTMPRTEVVSADRASEQPLEDLAARWGGMLIPEIRIKMRTLDDLETILKRELQKGRMYVRTSVYLESGTQVELQLLHPNSNRTYSLTAEVDHRVEQDDFEGLRVKLPNLEGRELSQFQRFVQTGALVTIDLDSASLADPEMVER